MDEIEQRAQKLVLARARAQTDLSEQQAHEAAVLPALVSEVLSELRRKTAAYVEFNADGQFYLYAKRPTMFVRRSIASLQVQSFARSDQPDLFKGTGFSYANADEARARCVEQFVEELAMEVSYGGSLLSEASAIREFKADRRRTLLADAGRDAVSTAWSTLWRFVGIGVVIALLGYCGLQLPWNK
jgi:hypothetical protein